MDITKRSRQLYDKLTRGWNTWNVASVTGQVYLPAGLEVRIGMIIPNWGSPGLCNKFPWDQVEKFGEHSPRGEYTSITVKFPPRPFDPPPMFTIESASLGDELLIRITPERTCGSEFISAEVGFLWGRPGTVTQTPKVIRAKAKSKTFRIDSPNPVVKPDYYPGERAHLAFVPAGNIYIRVNSRRSPKAIDSAIEQNRKQVLKNALTGTGDLGEGLTAMRAVLAWNTIYDPKNERVLTPVSRNWCRGVDYVLFDWDAFFCALMFGMIDKDLAYANALAIIEEITPEGFIPNYGDTVYQTRDRSEPQVGAYCVWKLYQQHGDKWLVEECFERLLKWNRWRFKERDKNGDGLMELGSTPWRGMKKGMVLNKQTAMLESGLDNSPMWDRARYNKKHHCLELSYVGLNALMVLDCQCLEEMAKLLGYKKEQKELAGRREKLSYLINTQLWNKPAGIYLNKDWQGRFEPTLAPTHFYPMLAGITSPEQNSRLIRKHLLNKREFWGKYVIPTVNRHHPAFKDQVYWRGNIWGPTNFLVAEGLRRAGCWEVSHKFARKSLQLLLRNWRTDGHVYENFDAITGRKPKKQSDAFYHWGALLVYIALQEVFDVQAWNGRIRLGCRQVNYGTVKNIPYRQQKYEVSVDKGLTVKCDGQVIIKKAKPEVIFR